MQSASLDMAELLKSLANRDGWASFDETRVRELQERGERVEHEQRLAEAKVVAVALTSPDGQRFLQWLLSKSMMAPLRSHETDAAGEQFLILAAQRQGKALLVQEILTLLAIARGQNPDEVAR